MSLWEKLLAVLVGMWGKSPLVIVSIPLPSGYTNPAKGIVMRPSDTMVIARKTYTDLSTIGQFLIDGDIFCHTLELSCRRENPEGKLAIPAGKYLLSLAEKPESPLELRFGFPLPLLNGVIGREGIRIHPANSWTELEGCIAPGNRVGIDSIFDSRTPFFKLCDEMRKLMQLRPLFLEIVGGM
jgi:hypothetical protein